MFENTFYSVAWGKSFSEKHSNIYDEQIAIEVFPQEKIVIEWVIRY